MRVTVLVLNTSSWGLGSRGHRPALPAKLIAPRDGSARAAGAS
jgi:hypothetical protein